MATDLRKAWKAQKKNADQALKRRGVSLKELLPFVEKEGMGPALDKFVKLCDQFEKLEEADKHSEMTELVPKVGKANVVLMGRLLLYDNRMKRWIKVESLEKYEKNSPERVSVKTLRKYLVNDLQVKITTKSNIVQQAAIKLAEGRGGGRGMGRRY